VACLGSKKVKAMNKKLNIKTLKDLKKAAKAHNIAIRKIAVTKKYKLNEYGLIQMIQMQNGPKSWGLKYLFKPMLTLLMICNLWNMASTRPGGVS
jgi:DNA polymerase/3'-5' exonuclease PolX